MIIPKAKVCSFCRTPLTITFFFLLPTNTWSCVILDGGFTAHTWLCLDKALSFLTCHMLTFEQGPFLSVFRTAFFKAHGIVFCLVLLQVDDSQRCIKGASLPDAWKQSQVGPLNVEEQQLYSESLLDSPRLWGRVQPLCGGNSFQPLISAISFINHR